MNDLIYVAVGFILAISLTYVLMPYLYPMIKKAYENKEVNDEKLPPQIWVAILLVPIVAGLLYAKLGSPQAQSVSIPTMPITDASPNNSMNDSSGHEMSDLTKMAEKLEKKLAANPNNPEGWSLLARSYVELKRHKEAVPAFEKALEKLPNDAQLIVDYVDARAVTQNHQLDAKSEELIANALKIEPNLPKAQMLAGTLAFDKKDYKKAIEIWEKLISTLNSPEFDGLKNEVQANIAEANNLLNK